MAAPSTGHPVTVTVGTAWRLQLVRPPPTPPRLLATATVIQVVLTAARVIFGLVYFQDCPQQPNIPKYLLGIALFPLLAALLTKDAARPQERPSCLKACLRCFLCLFMFAWLLLGAVWVFAVYQPNYDPFAADGLYCNKTLYTFAFWNAVLETFGFVAILAKLCKGLVCYVNLSPVDADFYRNV
ncbi:transmembrane protein 272-like [Gambusia affinis]|uniref:transmembrane protein 272-like n=1 Tax=Gambusia affinis TaxID=33528 RepID=UPI001CDC9A9D|nr:transmembrane protein 272-like [Gambusia affinis]